MTNYSDLYYEAQLMRAARQREANRSAVRKAVGIVLCIVVATPVTAACILYAILIAGGAS